MTLKETLTALFAVSIAIANVSAAKLTWFDLPLLGGVAVPAGFVAFGVAFLCSDLMVEFYGREYASRVVNGTIVALLAAYTLIYVAILLPSAPFGVPQDAYATVLGSGAGIVLASVITISVSQHVDVRLFDRIKRVTGTRHKWVRNIGSTSASQALDTVLFITLAFALYPLITGGEAMLGHELTLTIVGQYIVKLVLVALDTPLFYLITFVRGGSCD